MRIPINFNDPRWKKPDVYFTSIGIYLTVNIIVLTSIFLWLISEWMISVGIYKNSISAQILLFSPILLTLVVVSLLAIHKIFVDKNKTRYWSLAALILWSMLIIPISIVLIWLTNLYFDPDKIFNYLFTVTPMIVPNGMMYVFLFKGWKSVSRESA